MHKNDICSWCWGFSCRMVNEGAGGPRSRRGSHKVVPSSDQDGTGADRATGEVPCPSNGKTESLNKKSAEYLNKWWRQNSHNKIQMNRQSSSFLRSNVGHSTLTHWNQLQRVSLSVLTIYFLLQLVQLIICIIQKSTHICYY